MSRYYAVELKTIAIIQIDDATQDGVDAERLAEELESDILSDARGLSIEHTSLGPVTGLADLERHGWDGKCIPFGGDGNTCLEDLLPVGPAAKGGDQHGAVRCASRECKDAK